MNKKPMIDSAFDKTFENLKRSIKKEIARSTGMPKLASVTNLESSTTARVLIDGDGTAQTPATLFCSGVTTVGQRVLVLSHGTQYYIIGVKQ